MKCPACGHNTNAEYNYNTEIKNIIKGWNKSTQKMVTKTYKEIMSNIPSEFSKQKLFNFLLKVKEVDSRSLRIHCEGYLGKKYHMQGKGFNYLAAIILGSEKNKKTMERNERKTFGTAPPKVEIIENE